METGGGLVWLPPVYDAQLDCDGDQKGKLLLSWFESRRGFSVCSGFVSCAFRESRILHQLNLAKQLVSQFRQKTIIGLKLELFDTVN